MERTAVGRHGEQSVERGGAASETDASPALVLPHDSHVHSTVAAARVDRQPPNHRSAPSEPQPLLRRESLPTQ